MADLTLKQLHLPGEVTESSLDLPTGLPLSTWQEIGKTLARVDRAYRWWVGDWMNYGELEYGDAYTEALTITGLSYSSATQCKSIAASVESFRRRKNLSWAHHAEVAALEPSDQDCWLDRAEAQGWTVKELRAWLRGSKSDRLPVHTPLLRFCQNLETPIIVAQILRVYFPDAETAFDSTGGAGGFWDGSEPVQVTSLFVDPGRTDGATGDFRQLDYDDESFDVALFDPPHLADSSDSAVMAEKFGSVPDDELEAVIGDGCREAWRVARLGIIVKVTDHVHGQRYVLESDWVRQAIGQPPYDEVYQVRPNAMIDPKWEEQLSAYNNGSTYLIFRKGDSKHVGRRRT
jgi:hypothetical protein